MKKIILIIVAVIMLNGCSFTEKIVMPMGNKWDICFQNCSQLTHDIVECLETCIEHEKQVYLNFVYDCKYINNND